MSDLDHIPDDDRDLVEQYFSQECIKALGLDADSFGSETWREDFLRYLAELEARPVVSDDKKRNHCACEFEDGVCVEPCKYHGENERKLEAYTQFTADLFASSLSLRAALQESDSE